MSNLNPAGKPAKSPVPDHSWVKLLPNHFQCNPQRLQIATFDHKSGEITVTDYPNVTEFNRQVNYLRLWIKNNPIPFFMVGVQL